MAKTKKDAKKAAAKLAKGAEGEIHLMLLLDESGSMGGKEEAVVSGVNEFVDAFRERDATVTLSLFDDTAGEPMVRVKYAGKKVAKVKELTAKDYNPRGMTPLNDAVIETIKALDKKIGKAGRAFVVIMTDGMENASETSAEDVAKVVKKREKRGWAFLYLGADHDVQRQASAMGLGKAGQAFAFKSSKTGVGKALRSGRNLATAYASDAASYSALAADVHASTGGDLGEEEVSVTGGKKVTSRSR